jgi:hypothetical protein
VCEPKFRLFFVPYKQNAAAPVTRCNYFVSPPSITSAAAVAQRHNSSASPPQTRTRKRFVPRMLTRFQWRRARALEIEWKVFHFVGGGSACNRTAVDQKNGSAVTSAGC